jgi:dihydrofolate synthase/folylpolyglutamate synthase
VSDRSLAEWLDWVGRQHPVGIDMGLDRVSKVAEALGFEAPERRPAPRTIIVAGTNGKGSTTIFIEALLRASGFRVGTTISPHIHEFNERVRIDGRAVDDATLATAFAAVEAARGGTTLTYFEYSALVALYVFRSAQVDVAVLEVGLGGRLDAMNIVSADVAVVTSIGLDHEAFLGSDLEGIGREKAGVFRPGGVAVIGSNVTESVFAEATRLGCRIRAMGRDFDLVSTPRAWTWSSADLILSALPWGQLAPYNCALAIEAVRALTPVTEGAVREALNAAVLPGRCEAWRLAGVSIIVDVAHNPAGALFLRDLLAQRYPGARFVVILGMLADKDAAGVPPAFATTQVQAWIAMASRGPRGRSGADLARQLGVDTLQVVDTPAAALDAALEQIRRGSADTVLGFGSFSVVEDLRSELLRREAVVQGNTRWERLDGEDLAAGDQS